MLRYTVRQVPIDRTFALRKAVLRPHLPPDEPYLLPDDYEPTTVAFAAESDEDGSVLSCARITPEPPPFDPGVAGASARAEAGAGVTVGSKAGIAGDAAGDAGNAAGTREATGATRDAAAGDPAARGGRNSWRLRSMATDPAVRNQGVGAAVLQAAIDYAGRQGEAIFWCNARLPAQGLYARAGLQTYGEVWEEPDIGPHIVMWRRVP